MYVSDANKVQIYGSFDFAVKAEYANNEIDSANVEKFKSPCYFSKNKAMSPNGEGGVGGAVCIDRKASIKILGFGVHSLVEGGHHSTLDKALGKFERKTKVQPVRAAAKHDISTAGRALQWSAKGAGGKSLALAAGKALVETRKQVAPPPPTEELNNKHGTDSETGSDHSGSSYETDSDGDSSSDSDSSSSESS